MENNAREKHGDSLPTPGLDDPIPSWGEYKQLREAARAYFDHEPDDPR